MKKTFFTFFACAMALTMTANAKDTDYYQFINNKTILNLSESAEKEVAQDRIKATLRIEEASKINTTLQNRINEKMTQAVAMAKKYTDVKVSTGAYRVNQRWNSSLKKNDGWKGSQEIILDSANKELIIDVTQKLQAQGFNISGINYYLSREKAASFRTALINEALKRVQDRAKSVAAQLGTSTFHIGTIDVSKQQVARPQTRHTMMAEMSMDSKSMAAPVVEGSEERVAVSIRVTVILDLAQ